METLKYALNNNRAVYRFYFNNNMIHLDKSLDLPEEYVYFQVRDIRRDTKYYLTELTRVNETGVSIYPEDTTGNVIDALHHNGTYFVEFYNVSLELISQLVFTAKRAPGANTFKTGLDKYINYITVSTNRNILYVGESIKSINARVYAVMGDSSLIDITNNSQTSLQALKTDGTLVDITNDPLAFIDMSKINTSEEGFYKIRATFINRMDNRKYEASTTIEVTKTPDQQLIPGKNSIVLIPEYSSINRNFTMKCIGYFEDGTIRDITENVSLSPNVVKPNEEGYVDQDVLVIFNEGQLTEATIEKHVTFFTNEGLGHRGLDDRIIYNNDGEKIIVLSEDYIGEGVRYRVRHKDISLGENGYFTGQYGHTGYAIPYSNVNGDDIIDGQELIVELYNKNLGFTGAILLHAFYVHASELNY